MTPRDHNVRTWSMLCHLSALAGLLFGLGNVLGPLIVWQIKKNELPEIEIHGKESLNFQLTVFILSFAIGIILVAAAGAAVGFAHFIRSPFAIFSGGFGLGIIVVIINILAYVLAVVAGIKANNGETYKYPFSIKFIK